ncbi:MAG: ribose transport system ATP-binding protein [Nocardioidaceae bacterium]|nr:ribose transport system ATP-binding protein [Nocardioidaceae bacterium]
MLVAHNITKRYGGVAALSGANLTLRPGEVHALLGENGAGKSTLVRILAGAARADSGTIQLGDAPIEIANPRQARAHGIATVSQELNLFPDLDVLTNMFIHQPPLRSGLLDRKEMARAAQPHLQALGLEIDTRALLGDLSLAEQQLVEITRALITQPSVLVLDEPTSALAGAATQRLLDVVRRIRDGGVAVLYVSHFLQEVSAIADRITVLRDGTNALTDEDASALSVDDMVSAMLGQLVTRTPTAGRSARTVDVAAGGALDIVGLTVGDQLVNVSLQVGRAEVVGLAGLEGAGHTVVLEALWGRHPSATGEVRLPNGTTRIPHGTTEALRRGIAFIPSDRKRLGLMLDKPVWENITSVWALAGSSHGAVLRPARLRAIAQRWVDELHIRGTVETPAAQLSGGNQQKVVLAKWLQLNPSLFLLDDPTRGVDVRARNELHELVRRLAMSGCSVLICSTDMLELAEVCDRVILMRHGHVVRDASHDEMTEAGLLRALNSLPIDA